MIDRTKGIIDPPLDDLLERVDNKYQLVIFASKRARQINEYYSDLQDGAIYDNIGPLVDSSLDDKPLSIALREINQGKLLLRDPQPEAPAVLLDDEELIDFGADEVTPATVDLAEPAADDTSAEK